MTQQPFTDRIEAVLACLRGQVAYDTVAQQFNVPVDEVRRWEATFLAGGTSALGESAAISDVEDRIHEAQNRATEMGALNAISQSLTAILDLDELLDTTISTLYWVFGYTASIALVEGTNLVVKTGFALDGRKLPADVMKYPIPGTENITALCAANGRPLHVPDTAKFPRYVYEEEIGDVRSAEAMPMVFKGTVLGVLTARSARANAFGPHDASLLETIALNLAIAIENAMLFDAVEQANARFGAVLDATDDGVIVWDEFWRVLLANPAACRLLDTPPEDLIGCTSVDWKTQPRLAAVANAQENEHIDFAGDRPRVGRCRNLRWVSDRGSGYLTLISDITSEIELEKSREEVMSMLVHDLVSPLTSLVGGIETAREMYLEGIDQKRILHFMDMGSRNGRVLLAMIGSLLDIIRLEAGRMTLQYSPLNAKIVQALFEEVIGILTSTAETAQITVTAATDDDLPSLMADYPLLRRTLTNLLDNAIKFTPDGGRIELSAHREGEHQMRFSVSDTGPGIPEDFRKKIFERYMHVPGVEGRRRGTGLGLVFCRLVAEAHHGSIWVEPGAAGGSVFHFTVSGEEAASSS